MFYMQMPFFGGTLGLTGTDPVCGFVAGAFKPIFFNESFQQIQRVIVGLNPVVRDSSGI
jgi:hypothetical protein